MSMDQPPKEQPSSGLYITGLKLHNAGWDASKQGITCLPDGRESPVPLPLVWLRPLDTLSLQKINQQQNQQYSCPLYLSADSDNLCSDNIVTYINTQTLIGQHTAGMRNVYITAGLL